MEAGRIDKAQFARLSRRGKGICSRSVASLPACDGWLRTLCLMIDTMPRDSEPLTPDTVQMLDSRLRTPNAGLWALTQNSEAL